MSGDITEVSVPTSQEQDPSHTENDLQVCTIHLGNGQTQIVGNGSALCKGILKIDQCPSRTTCDKSLEQVDSKNKRVERRVVFADPVVSEVREIECANRNSVHCYCYCFGESTLVKMLIVMVFVLVILFLTINVGVQHASAVDSNTLFILVCVLGVLCLVTLPIAFYLLRKCVQREADFYGEV